MNDLHEINTINDRAAIKGKEVIYDKGLRTIRFPGQKTPCITATFQGRTQAEAYCRKAGATLRPG